MLLPAASDGSGPGARVTVDPSGNIYGMTPTGGTYGLGTIYKIRQDQNGASDLQVIHAFTGGADGATGSAGRMILRHGHLYGAATTGGTYGSGVVFELRPSGSAESGISGRFIRSEASRTEFFPMARCSSIVWVTFTERLITAERMVSALFTSYLRGLLANGTRACSIASKKEATAIAPSAILLLTRRQSVWDDE